MKERPILFSAPMVRAILAGTKTQTRRVIKGLPADPQNVRFLGTYLKCDAPPGTGTVSLRIPCPYYAVTDLGSRLWVRETWATHYKYNDRKPYDVPRGAPIYFRADGDPPHRGNAGDWRPSIFMLRWMSRITLEVEVGGVRARQLHAITDADAMAEGLSTDTPDDGLLYGVPGANVWRETPRAAYLELWDTINGERAPAKSNPWVWVVSFRRADQTSRIGTA